MMGNVILWGVGDDPRVILTYSLTAVFLAAVIERPFVKAAGVQGSVFHHSVRANIVSWIAGFVVAFASLASGNDFFLLLLVVFSVPFAILVEGYYLGAVQRESEGRLKWWPIVLGNVVSSLILLAINFAGSELADRLQRSGSLLQHWMREQLDEITFVVCLTAGGLFFLILFLPTKRRSPVSVHSPANPADVSSEQMLASLPIGNQVHKE